LVVAQNAGRQLLVNVVTLDMPDLKLDPQMTSAPRIGIENVRAPVPYRCSKSSNVQNGDCMIFDTSSQFLSHLEIVPTSDVEKVLQLPPTILAFYTPVEDAMSLIHDGPLGSTTVRRWHVVPADCKLHPSFDSMESKAGNGILSRRTDLVRLDDVHLNRIITGVQKVDGGENLALGSSDGSLTIYPSSLSGLYTANDSGEVRNLAQTGFTFPPYSRGLKSSVSPNGCLAVSLTDDNEMRLICLEHSNGLSYTSTGSTTLEATTAAIILAFARSFASGVSCNDIIVLVHQHLDPARLPDLIESILKALFTDGEATLGPEQGKLLKPIVPRILSLIAALGFDSPAEQRTSSSMLSWLSLNIRSHALAFRHMLVLPKDSGGVDWKDSGVCEIACNSIRWTLDLFKFIVDDLFEMSDQQNSPFPSPAGGNGPDHEADPHLMTKLVLVSSWQRNFLPMIPRMYRGIVDASLESKTKLTPETAPSFLRMAALIEASPLKMEPLEQLLIGVDKIVNHIYNTSNMSDSAKADSQRFMLAHGRIPDELLNVVPMILQDVLPTTSGKMDRLSLYMVDHSWLGIRDDAGTRAFKRDFVVDVYRKIVLKRNALGKVRRCVRCGSVSTNLIRMRHWPQYLQLLKCICEDHFTVVYP
jgi:mediator of RNA polymerase II transcription subunit 16, fungi type